MERLTVRDEFGNADIIGVDTADLQGNLRFDELNKVTRALNRLATLEDRLESGRIFELTTKIIKEGTAFVSRDGTFGTTMLAIPITEEQAAMLIKNGVKNYLGSCIILE